MSGKRQRINSELPGGITNDISFLLDRSVDLVLQRLQLTCDAHFILCNYD